MSRNGSYLGHEQDPIPLRAGDIRIRISCTCRRDRARSAGCRQAAGELAKTDARANILSAGLGGKFAKALRLNVYPKKGTSLKAAALIFHKIPYAGVFEEGATIRGRPRMWVPLPSTPKRSGRYRMTPERYQKEIGPLQYVKRPGKAALLVAKIQATKSGKRAKVTLSGLRAAARGGVRTTSVPVFVGIDSVSIRKRLDITKAVRRARDRLPELYAQNLRGDLMASGRNVINQSIRLEGGDEILRQLRSLGEEGERSARKLEQAFGRVNLGNSFAAQFGRLRTSFADLRTAGGRVATSFAGLTRGLADVGSAFASTSARVTVFAAAVTGAAYAAGAFIRNSLNRVDELGDLASSLGVTVTQLQSLQAAATVSGIDSGTLSRGFISIGEALKELQGTTVKATSGKSGFPVHWMKPASSTVKVIAGFDSYGQVVRQGAGETAKLSESARTLSRILKNVGLKPGQEILPVDAFRAVANQFASMEDGAQKTQSGGRSLRQADRPVAHSVPQSGCARHREVPEADRGPGADGHQRGNLDCRQGHR